MDHNKTRHCLFTCLNGHSKRVCLVLLISRRTPQVKFIFSSPGRIKNTSISVFIVYSSSYTSILPLIRPSLYIPGHGLLHLMGKVSKPYSYVLLFVPSKKVKRSYSGRPGEILWRKHFFFGLSAYNSNNKVTYPFFYSCLLTFAITYSEP